MVKADARRGASAQGRMASSGRPRPRAGRRPDRTPRARRLRRWAILAVLFPVFFLVVIGIGVAAMYYRRMEFFKPPAVGALPAQVVAHVAAGPRAALPTPPA
jgi:hypothetical protein